MSISTYAELKASIASWLNRDDLTSVIPDFIALAEADINRKLRHYKMVERVDATLDSRYVQLPANWLETIRFSITTSPTYRLEAITVDDMLKYREDTSDASGRPRYYTHIGEAIEVFPTPDAEYGMQLAYYEEVAALSDSNTFNWLIQMAPDVYLYGALLQAAPYLLDDGRIQVWNGLYQNALGSLQQASDETKFTVTSPRMRLSSF